MAKEVWKPIKEYEGLYEVSNCGKVRSVRGKVMKQRLNQWGYYKVQLTKNGIQRELFVHRLVALAFIPNTRNVECVNHIDECKTNNNVENLEWVTHHENNYHGTARERISKSLHEYYKENGHHCRKPVRCLETNCIYSGVRVASRELGINLSSLCACLNGKRHTAGGFRWEYVR